MAFTNGLCEHSQNMGTSINAELQDVVAFAVSAIPTGVGNFARPLTDTAASPLHGGGAAAAAHTKPGRQARGATFRARSPIGAFVAQRGRQRREAAVGHLRRGAVAHQRDCRVPTRADPLPTASRLNARTHEQCVVGRGAAPRARHGEREGARVARLVEDARLMHRREPPEGRRVAPSAGSDALRASSMNAP